MVLLRKVIRNFGLRVTVLLFLYGLKLYKCLQIKATDDGLRWDFLQHYDRFSRQFHQLCTHNANILPTYTLFQNIQAYVRTSKYKEYKVANLLTFRIYPIYICNIYWMLKKKHSL